MNNSSHPFIKPPFPPLIDPKDLLIIGKDNKPSRSPNAFIIYRKVFFKTTRDQGYSLPMTIVSSMASKSWDQEPDEVRSYYKTLAKEAYKYRTEKFPKKIKRRKKKEPWKADIAFQNDLYNTFLDDERSKETSKLQPVEQSNETLTVSQDSSSNLSSRNSSPNLEQTFENNFQELNAPNNDSNISSPNINSIMVNDLLNYNSDQPYLFGSSNVEYDLPINFDETSYDQNLTNLRQENDFSNQIDLTSFDNHLNMFYNHHFNTSEFNANATDLLNSIQYQHVLGINTGSEYENSFQL